jgi:membrane-anchored mycosin MYCP
MGTIMKDSPRQVYGGPYRCAPGQIAVGLPHRNLVMNQLTSFGAKPEVIRTSTLLDLALIEIPDAASTAERLREGAPDDRTEARDDLGVVLTALRKRFGELYAGWAPVLGKNRLVGQLHGAQEVIHSGDDPRALAERFNPPERSSGPGRGVRVGLLDTGLFPQPWLGGAWAARYSDRLLPTDALPYAAGHATFVAGLILSQAGGATVEARKVIDNSGTAESWTVAEEIVRMGRSGIDVLNLSFACYTEDGEPPLVLAAAVDRIYPDVVVVAAAGNHGAVPDEGDVQHSVKPAWPAALSDVIAVGAVDAKGQRADFSPDAPWVDVQAPGDQVRSTYLDTASNRRGEATLFPGGWAQWSGTSFAAALVSGAIAAATQPGRVTAREAAQDLLASLDDDGVTTIGRTAARSVRLPLW